MNLDRPLPREEYAKHLKDKKDECIFCTLNPKLNLLETENWIWAYSAFPYRKYHTLIIAKRHVNKFHDLNTGEFEDLKKLTRKIENIFKRSDLIAPNSPYGDQIFFTWRSRSEESEVMAVSHLHLHSYPKFAVEQDTPQIADAWDIDLDILKKLINAYE